MPADPLPPGPRTPAFAQMLRYSFRPIEFLEGCHREFGDRFTMRLSGLGTFVQITDPGTIKDILRGRPDVLHSGEGNAMFRKSVGEHSVLVLDEDEHRRQRRVQVPAFKGERMRSFFDDMRDETARSIEQWPRGEPFPVDAPMRDITVRVILQTIFGFDVARESERQVRRRIATLAREVLDYGATRWALILMTFSPKKLLSNARWVPYFGKLETLREELIQAIRARRESIAADGATSSRTILSDLLAEHHEDGSPATDEELRDAVMTLLMAGHETTATALAWAYESILSHAEVHTRLLGEFEDVVGHGELQAEHLPQMTYLDAVVRETLRHRPILPFFVRLLKKPFTAGGIEYPPGIKLCPSIYLVHHRDDLYPDPYQFRPERFLERKYGPHEWIPFGGGDRVCLGMSFAMYEMKVVLAATMSRLALARPSGASSRVTRRGVVLVPDDGAKIVATEKTTV